MEPLLLVGYGAVFVGLAAYLLHLRSRLSRLERKVDAGTPDVGDRE